MAEIKKFTNEEDAMSSIIVDGQNGRFNVVIQDDDSGSFLPMSFCGYNTIEQAEVKAKSVINL